MASALRHADLPALVREAEVLVATARQEFGGLSSAQVNWKPDVREWSIGQCFDHMILAVAAYFPTLRAIQTHTKRATVWERLPLLPRLFGPLLIHALDPERGRKIQAPAGLRPTQSAIDPSIVQRFDDTHRELVAFMAATATPGALTTIVTSPMSRFITYPLLDAYRIIVVHDHLHVRQARNVAASAAFPRLTPIR